MKLISLITVVIAIFLSSFETQVTAQVVPDCTSGPIFSPSTQPCPLPGKCIKLFDEQTLISTGVVLPPPPCARNTKSALVTRQVGETAFFSSTADGTGVPNVDDQLVINGTLILGGKNIRQTLQDNVDIHRPGFTIPPGPSLGCVVDIGISVNVCAFPFDFTTTPPVFVLTLGTAFPFGRPIEVTQFIPIEGGSPNPVTFQLLDFGGGYGNTEIFLVILPADSQSDDDNDGISNDEDVCPNSDLSPIVVIDGCDSGVGNTFFASGCTISDLIAECTTGASNHDQFVSCVSHVTNDLKKAGAITGQQKDAIQSCAEQANVP